MNSSYKRSSSPQRKRTRKGLALFTLTAPWLKKKGFTKISHIFSLNSPFIEKDTAKFRILGIIGKALDHPEFFETVDFLPGVKYGGSKSS